MRIGNINIYGIIYKITNIINNKSYIGQTTRGFNKRYEHKGIGIERVYKFHLSQRKRNLKYNKHLLESIEKCGFDAFEVIEILDIAFSKKELDIKEKHYIELFDCYKNGYNNTLGGEGGNGCNPYKNKTDEELKEIKEKISNSLKGRYVSEETKNKRSKSLMGHKVSEDTKQKISEKAKLRIGKDSYRAKSVICITTGKIFFTLKEGSKFYNCNKESLSMCCSGKRKSCGKLSDGTKLVWMYLETFLSLCEFISL